MFQYLYSVVSDFFAHGAPQTLAHASDGTVYAVDLTDPIGFTAYIGMAFVLYAIRETEKIPLKYMPLIAIVLGLAYASFVEYHEFSEASVIAGLRLALLGIGSVATVKYFLNGNGFNDGSGGASASVHRDLKE